MVSKVFLCLLWVAVFAVSLPGRADEFVDRPVLTILRFGTPDDDAELSRFSYLLEKDLAWGFSETKGLRIQSSQHGRRYLKIGEEDSISKDQEVEIGRMVEARRVLAGEMARDGEGWRATARLVNPANGKAETFAVSGEDWWRFRRALIDGVFTRMDVKPTESEKKRVYQHWTESDEAIGLIAKLTEKLERQGPEDEDLELVQRVVELDPRSARAWVGLARFYLFHLQDEMAEEPIRKAIELDPDSALIWYVHAALLAKDGHVERAEAALEVCLEKDPEYIDGLRLKAALWRSKKQRPQEGLRILNRARRVDPFDAGLAAQVAVRHAMLGNREAAERGLREAVKLAAGEPPLVAEELQIGMTAERLGLVSQALESYRLCLTQGRVEGLSEEKLEVFESRIKSVSGRLVMTPVPAKKPRRYSPDELDAALRARLDDGEYRVLRYPLSITPEMRRWAHELVEGIDGDEEKARKLFEVMSLRLGSREMEVSHTAEEVFRDWRDTSREFSCQENAKLFTVLARELGLDAFMTTLEKDCYGDVVYHACAALFLGDDCYLIDPSYNWFGVAHQDYIVLDDLQAVAMQMSQDQTDETGLASARIASRIFPESSYVRLMLAHRYVEADRFDEAEEEIDEAERLKPRRWDVPMFRSALELERGNLEQARKLADGVVLAQWKSSEAHAILALVMVRQGDWAGAREHYRECLRLSPRASTRSEVLGRLAQINEHTRAGGDSHAATALRLRAEGNVDGAIEAYRKAAEEEPDSAIIQRYLGMLLLEAGQTAEGVASIRRFFERSPDELEETWGFFFSKLQELKLNREAEDLIKMALQRNPDWVGLWAGLSSSRIQAGDCDGALEISAKAIERFPESGDLRIWNAVLLSLLGEWDRAEKALDAAAGLEPANPASAFPRMVIVLCQIGRPQEAVVVLDKHAIEDGRELAEQMQGIELELMRYLAEPERDIDGKKTEALLEKAAGITETTKVADSQAKNYHAEHSDRLARYREQREVTTVSVPAGDEAEEIAADIHTRIAAGMPVGEAVASEMESGSARMGERDWVSREDLVEVLRDPVFGAEAGSPTEIVEFRGHRMFGVVHAIRPGDAGTWEDRLVRKDLENLIGKERRIAWRERYLKRLKSKVDAGGD